MKDVYVIAENIISPVGKTAEENFHAVLTGRSGVTGHQLPAMSPVLFYASLFSEAAGINDSFPGSDLTKFEKLVISSMNDAVEMAGIGIQSADTIVILSTTKGNIALLETGTVSASANERLGLYSSAKQIAGYCKLAHAPLVISNACISGLTALLTGKRLIETGQYRNAVVVGADCISSFVLSGFQSFQAVSQQPCRPFDAARNGINLGEAAATVVLSADKHSSSVRLAGGGITNDANHISGPSRSGQELSGAIQKAVKQAAISITDIGFVSAHGTATLYNDEMEAKAFSLAGLEDTPVNSLKGYYGHTLGAAGVVESVIGVYSLRENKMIGTKGFSTTGVSKPINVASETKAVSARHFLKTASGFGGCNAALVFSKTGPY